jgi:hypothetical protein
VVLREPFGFGVRPLHLLAGLRGEALRVSALDLLKEFDQRSPAGVDPELFAHQLAQIDRRLVRRRRRPTARHGKGRGEEAID